MRLEVSNRVDPSEWDGLICRLGGTLFHSSTWAAYQQASSPHLVPLFAIWRSEGGQVRGAALAFLGESPNKLLAPLTRRFWTDALPLAVEGVSRAELISLLEAEAVRRKAVELSIGSFASPGDAGLAGMGFTVTHRFEFELSLLLSEEALWDAMESQRRNKIRKAGRVGITIQNLSPEEGCLHLRRLQAASNERILARGGPDITRKAGGGDPVRLLLDSGMGRIVGAVVETEVVSAGLFVSFNGLVYYVLSGHTRRGLETQAPTLLLWETAKQYRSEGAARFNLGGSTSDALREDSSEHGVYLYKLAFGGARLDCFTGEKTLRANAARLAQKLKSVRSTLGR
jgi:hypothetical protein